MFHKFQSTSLLLFRSNIKMLKCNASSLDGKMMNKVMGLSRKTKKVWYKPNVGANPTFEELMKQTTKNNAGRQTSKRIAVLNKLLMKNITDLMATGENSDKLIGYGLEISKVSIAGDYRSVKVYWMAGKSEDDSQLDELLKMLSGSLRHELSVLRIMGEVPKILFIKDRTYANVAAVDRLLNKADFGEDFIPTCNTLLIDHPTIYKNIDPEIKKKIEELEDTENLTEDSNDEVIIPEMKMDVMGLDHSAIMARLNTAIQKSKAAHRQPCAAQNVMKNTVSEHTEDTQYLSFTDFVKKRKIQEAKSLGRRRSRSIEKEMYDKDVSWHYEEEDDNIDEYPFKIDN
ncbi:putative ribosome-binding factor A, mitochondrial isoform X1 [Melanaphis sacchari]|uniref:Putative ribosome-binding factor A, mitochondrial n=2 Tax=Melanaphis sacchari TaxID=742174 RepID=A0A2H8TSM7_9HEMI|nr:putative ribosome-binding factor A, mitochondrial isoform X1 [Melanaphis sacchari]